MPTDVPSPEKFRAMDGRTFTSESEEAFCAWTAALTEDGSACDYEIEVFTRAGKLWRRSTEEHREYVHDPARLKEVLLSAGFGAVEIRGGLPLRAPEPGEERLFFTAE